MKDKSLEELNILKIVIYVLSFITVCTALILFLLLPALKDYKQTHLRKICKQLYLMQQKLS